MSYFATEWSLNPENIDSFRLFSAKWTSGKNLKKARQVEYQKIQRKFRKERKDVEKAEATMESTASTMGVAVLQEENPSSTRSILLKNNGSMTRVQTPPEISLKTSGDEASGHGRNSSTMEPTKVPGQMPEERIDLVTGTRHGTMPIEDEFPRSDSDVKCDNPSSSISDKGKGSKGYIDCYEF